jgi:DNA-binding XRE family transcriptional regulator
MLFRLLQPAFAASASTRSTRQIKAARALLAWSQEELAKRSAVSYPTIARLEAEDGQLGGRSDTGDKITSALKSAGVIFVAENGDGPGVRLKKQKALDGHIKHLEGKVADLKGPASGEPSPAKGMAMLRRGRATSDLAKAKNRRAKGSK